MGSHTALTTTQLNHATGAHRLPTVQLDVEELIADDAEHRRVVVAQAASNLRDALAAGDAALVTSRKSAHKEPGQASLALAATIAGTLVEIVQSVASDVPLGWLIAKGGITSHDLAVKALNARRATVLGQYKPVPGYTT